MRRYKVIQWSTGNVGKLALRGILQHPQLELVGLWVHSAEKAGRDAGELAGLRHAGVAATNDAAALLAMDADCVCYTATADLRPGEAVEDLCRILESGKNVVSSSVVSFVFPPAANPELRERIEKACTRGGSTFYTSGIDPGFANDALPLTLLSCCERVDTVRIAEILNYATYHQPEVLFETMGFGKPLEHDPILLIPGILQLAWGPTVRMIAHAMGAELDEIREEVEKRPAPEDFSIPCGPVARGTMAALRFEVQGIVGGRPAIVIEHVTRLRDDLAPDWPQPVGAGCYRVTVEGNPSMVCDVAMKGEDGDVNTGGLVATAMRLLNAVPAVCAAKPGLVSLLDLPVYTGPMRARA